MIIGIAGGTCSGKTKVAYGAAKLINAKVISLDNYFKDPSSFPIVEGKPDYDRIEAIDWQKVLNDIKNINDNLIVEGFLALANKKIRSKMDKTFFIDKDENTLIKRRLARDPLDGHDYIVKHVRQRHRDLVLPTKKHADIVLNGDRSVDELIHEVYTAIRS